MKSMKLYEIISNTDWDLSGLEMGSDITARMAGGWNVILDVQIMENILEMNVVFIPSETSHKFIFGIKILVAQIQMDFNFHKSKTTETF